MNKFTSIVSGIVLSLATLVTFSFAQSPKSTADDKLLYNKPATELRMAMHKLWAEHVAWTRNYTTGALTDLGDTDEAAKRLLKNQDDIGNAIKPYYGQDASKKLADLLRSHIMIATEVVKAAKEGDQAALKTAQSKWRANAGDIATFLSGANPNWSKKELNDMLNMHLDLITGEVTSRLKKDWAEDVSYSDKNFDHMLKLADILTDGIVKQFPDKFSK